MFSVACISHFHTGTTDISFSVSSSSYVISRHFQSSCALAYFTNGDTSLLSGLILDAVGHLYSQLLVGYNEVYLLLRIQVKHILFAIPPTQFHRHHILQ